MSSFLRRIASGIRDFVYNVSRGQYETADGQVVPAERVVAAVERRQEDGAQLVNRLAGELAAGSITAREWQDMFAVELRRMHSQSFAAGRGGWDAVTIADRAIIEARLRDEYAFLRELADEVARGNITNAELVRRMNIYVGDVKSSYWDGRTKGQESAGQREEMRVLGATDRHCSDCVSYAGHWEPIGSLPEPGDQCQCIGNCLCTKTYRSKGV
jgi:hypothetical protein